jgi:hypothetical protein
VSDNPLKRSNSRRNEDDGNLIETALNRTMLARA